MENLTKTVALDHMAEIAEILAIAVIRQLKSPQLSPQHGSSSDETQPITSTQATQGSCKPMDS